MTLKIGLPKGVTTSKAQKVISDYLKRDIDSATLHHFDEKEQIHFYLLKPRDIPKLVHDDILDAGITLIEWIVEKGYPLHLYKKLDWCNTRISLLAPRKSKFMKADMPITCVTEFPNIASRFFQEKGIQEYTIEHVSGSCEAMVPSVYDYAIDCVETGSSAQRHDLIEEATILSSKAVLVTKTSMVLPQLQRVIGGLGV